MTPFVSPAASALWECVSAVPELRFGPLSLSRVPVGIEVRPCQDAGLSASSLRVVPVADLRTLSQTDDLGRFRPNKASPNLIRGWAHLATDPQSLDAALDSLIPGGLADWYAVRSGTANPVPWQQYADRQTGMYRNVSALNEPEAEEVARAGCHERCCTRRRLWTVGDRPPEAPSGKSEVPCLEPCALLLELARRAQRSNASEERSQLTLPESDLAIIDTLFDIALDHPDASLREGDLSAPGNPRRILLLREKLLPWLPAKTRGSGH
jgi:hypothetical protein